MVINNEPSLTVTGCCRDITIGVNVNVPNVWTIQKDQKSGHRGKVSINRGSYSQSIFSSDAVRQYSCSKGWQIKTKQTGN